MKALLLHGKTRLGRCPRCKKEGSFIAIEIETGPKKMREMLRCLNCYCHFDQSWKLIGWEEVR